MKAEDCLRHYDIPSAELIELQGGCFASWKFRTERYRITIVKENYSLSIRIYDQKMDRHISHRYRMRNAIPILHFLKLI